MPTALVSISWLKRNISSTGLILLDASMNKVVGKTPLVYDSPTYIPNSQKLSLETDFCDLESSLTHTLPTTDQFLNTCSKLGISDDNTVVIYDNQGIYSAPRAWWTFKIMGFDKVFVLDGGLPQWLDEGNPVD